ncbi:MAG: hypothetical protein PVJ49_04370, partial [Acidobacteriota bacterium]
MRLSSRKVQITIVLLVSGVFLLWAGTRIIGPLGGGVTTPVSVVTRGEFVHRINANGVLASEMATEITVPQGRRGPMYIAWIAEDGSEVHEGDLLVQFDSTDLENQLLESQDELQQTLRRRDQRVEQEQTALANLELDATRAERQL